MNNAFLASESVSLSLEEKVDITSKLKERETEIIKIIEAINAVKVTQEWSTLKSLVFDSRIESLEKQIYSEALIPNINDPELYRLQGRLYEAKQYDLDSLIEKSKSELLKIRQITRK